MDSTGIAALAFTKPVYDKPNNDPVSDVEVFKATVPSYEFLDIGRAKQLITNADMMLMGHCRSRTVGEINKKNAQPFNTNNVVGTHNGTLAYYSKNKLEGPGVHFQTDSEGLINSINIRGLEESVKLMESKDAAALVWYDKVKHELNFYRNTERPLFYVYDEKRTRVYWASESGMLYLILNRNGIKFEKVRMLPENIHLTLPMPSVKEAVFPKPVSRFCEISKTAIVPRSESRVFPQRNNDGELGLDKTNPLARQILSFSKPLHLNNKIIDLGKFRLNRMIVRRPQDGGSYYKTDNNQKTYVKEIFVLKMQEGCAVCSISPAWGEPVKFLLDDSFLCASCVSEAKDQLQCNKMNGTTLSVLSQLG